jgi:hypothetical protein
VSSLTDDPRTAKQLRAEIAVLERQLEEQGTVAGTWSARRTERRASRRATRHAARDARQQAAPQGSPSLVPAIVPVTRRAALALWLAPMILLAPAVKTARRFVKSVKRGVVG